MKLTRLSSTGLTLIASVALAAAAESSSQRTFATPQEAAQATVQAAEANDTSELSRIFGPGGKDIVQSGDPAEDKRLRAEFAASARAKLVMDEDSLSPDRVTFTVGSQEWPFPVPVIRVDGKWRLDSASGRMEILARRIGRNELNATEVCLGYVEAQMEYAGKARDGDSILKYAQRIAATSGKQDGLYSGDTPASLVSQAFASAVAAVGTEGSSRPVPYHGYYFHILKGQGPDATGGAFDYVVGGKMIGGFALVAWPASYGISGVRTMIVSRDGVVYEKDLGSTTAQAARQMTRFNPDKSWRRAAE